MSFHFSNLISTYFWMTKYLLELHLFPIIKVSSHSCQRKSMPLYLYQTLILCLWQHWCWCKEWFQNPFFVWANADVDAKCKWALNRLNQCNRYLIALCCDKIGWSYGGTMYSVLNVLNRHCFLFWNEVVALSSWWRQSVMNALITSN